MPKINEALQYLNHRGVERYIGNSYDRQPNLRIDSTITPCNEGVDIVFDLYKSLKLVRQDKIIFTTDTENPERILCYGQFNRDLVGTIEDPIILVASNPSEDVIQFQTTQYERTYTEKFIYTSQPSNMGYEIKRQRNLVYTGTDNNGNEKNGTIINGYEVRHPLI
jgi:hypothetical protein